MKLIRHSLFNLLGLGLPLLVAVYSIPVLIDELGTPRFGLLTMVWAVVSYFGLFDLGLGRALTQRLAVLLAQDDQDEVGPLISTAIFLMAALGALAGLAMFLLADWAVAQIKEVPDNNEAVRAIYAMAIAMPAVVMTSGFRGVLEAKSAFGLVNLIRVPMGLFTFLGPLAVVQLIGPRLDYVAYALAGGRVLACFIHWIFVRRSIHSDLGWRTFNVTLIAPLCSSGGWLTVSNIISPLMSYVDRFLIGSLVSAAAVAYYVTPHEMITKIWIVPGAVTAVLFPAFAAQVAKNNSFATDLYFSALRWLFLIMLPVTLSIAVFAEPLLRIWISAEFAEQSAALLQIFSLGMFATCLANIPFTLIQSAGRARTTAIIHTIEFPLFLLILWFFTNAYGLEGAAFAWLLRVLIDAVLMFIAARPLLPSTKKHTISKIGATVAILFSGLAYAGVLLPENGQRAGWLVLAVLVLAGSAVIRKHDLRLPT